MPASFGCLFKLRVEQRDPCTPALAGVLALPFYALLMAFSDADLKCTSVGTTTSATSSNASTGKANSRNLIICIDGTSNKFGQYDTNIVKLYADINREDDKQRTYYTSGIGTGLEMLGVWGCMEKAISVKFDMANASGLRRMRDSRPTRSLGGTIKDTYDWLARMYGEGDRIFLFGFSRGYRVRVLSAVLHEVGLIRNPTAKQVGTAYDDHYEAIHSRKPKINLVPPTLSFAARICYFRHALALDKRRVGFVPEYCHGVSVGVHEKNDKPDVKEVWFSGSHSDVGGSSRPGTAFQEGHVWKSENVVWTPDDLDFGNRDSISPARKFAQWLPVEDQVSHNEIRDSGGVKCQFKCEWVASSVNNISSRNIVLLGEMGVGKSSIINSIAGTSVARVSDAASICTLQPTEHVLEFDSSNLHMHDTTGLSFTNYPDALAQAYTLIRSLQATTGVHLIIFCVRAGSSSLPSLEHHYRLIRDFMCQEKVPIALVVTGLEHEARMEDWWDAHCHWLGERRIRFAAHACITATAGYSNAFAARYLESAGILRQLLRTCLREPSGSSGRRWRRWMPKPGRKKMMRQLVTRYGLTEDTAEEVVRRIRDVDNRDK